MRDTPSFSPYYCSDCMIKHAGLARYHLLYDNQAIAMAHLHEALREAPFLCTRSLRVIRCGECTRSALQVEATWLFNSALLFRSLEADSGGDEAIIEAAEAAFVSRWNERPSDGVASCVDTDDKISIDVSLELLRIYVGEMLSGYLDMQLALAIGVLSEHESRQTVRNFRKSLVAAVMSMQAGSDKELKAALVELDTLLG